MNQPDLSIIIVTHNAREFLRATLASLARQKGVTSELIVVDNHSTDRTHELVKKQFPQVKWLTRQTSEGFSAANNLGVKLAQADLLLFCNPDITLPDEGALAKLVSKYHATNNLGLLTPRVNLISGGIDKTCHRGFPTPWAAFTHFSGLERMFPTSRWFSQYTQGYKGYDTEHEVDAVGGMFTLLSRQVGQEVNWWDEDYPFYGEDLDLSYRVRALGLKNLYYPAVTVLHHKGATTGMSKSSKTVTSANHLTTRRVKSWSIEAMQTFYQKHYRQKYPVLVTSLVMLGIRLLRFRRLRLS